MLKFVFVYGLAPWMQLQHPTGWKIGKLGNLAGRPFRVLCPAHAVPLLQGHVDCSQLSRLSCPENEVSPHPPSEHSTCT